MNYVLTETKDGIARIEIDRVVLERALEGLKKG